MKKEKKKKKRIFRGGAAFYVQILQSQARQVKRGGWDGTDEHQKMLYGTLFVTIWMNVRGGPQQISEVSLGIRNFIGVTMPKEPQNWRGWPGQMAAACDAVRRQLYCWKKFHFTFEMNDARILRILRNLSA